jgi:hypothetical protein
MRVVLRESVRLSLQSRERGGRFKKILADRTQMNTDETDLHGSDKYNQKDRFFFFSC